MVAWLSKYNGWPSFARESFNSIINDKVLVNLRLLNSLLTALISTEKVLCCMNHDCFSACLTAEACFIDIISFIYNNTENFYN